MNMFLALVAFVVIRVIRGVCLTYLFRGGSPEAEPEVCWKKTHMPRYKFHANVEASIPSAPGTQLMSRTNYEAVADFAGHWLHRAQVSLLRSNQIGSHPKKNPGAGLVRAWRGCCVKHTNPESQGNFSERTEWYSTALAAGIEPRAE